MTTRPSPTPALPASWVMLCAFCACVGWGLSALHALNPAGYVMALVLGLAALAGWIWKVGWPRFRLPRVAKLRKRFGRLFPMGFMILTGLALLGGALYLPSNYDALAYRTPRVLHWLAADRWHWIHTEFHRLNVRGCGMEWLTAPLLALTRSDRALFLISATSFLLLPGRVFSLLIRLGVRKRVAWHWMWLFPTGYCFLLQAGSIANDLFGATLALLAIEFALRARASQSWFEAAISVLAAALMTAAKAFNLVLLLPWAIALLGPSGRGALVELWRESALRPLFRRPWAFAPLLLVAAGASLLPTALLNARHCGDWTGAKAEDPTNLSSGAKGLHIAANTVVWTISNLTPPVFPFAGAWNRCMDRTIPEGLARRLQHNFEPYAAHLYADEMASEESAGLGFGVSVMLLAWAGQRCLHRRAVVGTTHGFSLFGLEVLVPLGTGIALLVLMTQCGFSGSARYLGPFYVLLAAPLLAGASAAALVPSACRTARRQNWFRLGGMGVFALALLPVFLSPARPLWPASRVLARFGGQESTHALVRRAATVYAVQGHRPEAFEPALAAIPSEANPLGVTTSDDPETSLWRPFGHRRILHVCSDDSPEKTRRRGIRYALVSSVRLERLRTSLEQWLAQQDAELVQRVSLELRATTGPKDWFVVRFR